MKNRFATVTLLCLALATGSQAQSIRNNSFESGFDDWDNSGMQTQTNTVFTLKQGTTYVEKWTSRGSAVGSCYVRQTLTGLTAGQYTLTVAAQNIQEDTPTSAQTGAWIYLNDQKQAVDVTQQYSVTAVILDGQAEVGFEAQDASGNWIAVDNFVLTLTSTDASVIRAALLTEIEAAEAYTDSTLLEADMQALKAVIADARKVYDSGKTDEVQQTVLALRQAIVAAQKAIWTYKKTLATEDNPLELTAFITNPSFENGVTGWTNVNMQTQSNTAFAQKQGTVYMEKWTSAGGAVGDGKVSQVVPEMSAGNYILTVRGQNIQEGSASVRQSGFWLFADESREGIYTTGQYTLKFTNIDQDITLGVVAEAASGNWIAFDDFRLYYTGYDMASLQAKLSSRIEEAKVLLKSKMQNAACTQLEEAIQAATEVLSGDQDATRYASVSAALRAASSNAQRYITAYAELQAKIDECEKIYSAGDTSKGEDFRAAIDQAQAICDNLDSEYDSIVAQMTLLTDAAFAYRINNPSGTVPHVVTEKRYVRGAIEAFFRSTITGVTSSQISEEGICWSEYNPEPTVLDSRSTDYLDSNGKVYRAGLQPGTLYYVRAYAMTKNYAVGYGDVIRISTLPLGSVTWTYDYGGDEAQNNKNVTALSEACSYWSNYSSIRGFNVSCVYSPGTPTADCGYGGGMRIGTNMGQRTGTCMHEMSHGIGMGTLGIWGGWETSPMRAELNGDWAGDRANTVVQFWENRDDVLLTGAYDNAHWGMRAQSGSYVNDGSGTGVWCNKYPFNGAHLEPYAWAGAQNWNDTQVRFICNSMINQGFCEDGMVPVNYYGGAFCLPAYVFEQRDDVKYYIKSESSNRGLYTSFLTENSKGQLKWTAVETDDLAQADSSAWYITFDAANQYYMLRNAATGHYVSYNSTGSNGYKTKQIAVPTNDEKFHVMQRKSPFCSGDDQNRGYWFIRPGGSACLQANASGITAAATLNEYDAATTQRWLIYTLEEALISNSTLEQQYRDELMAMIENWRRVQATPHTANAGSENADSLLTATLDDMESQGTVESDIDVLKELVTQTRAAGISYLPCVTPNSINEPFDLTFLMQNAAVDSKSGWSEEPTLNYSCGEFFEKTFDFNQTVTGLPKGTYKLSMQGFQRPGSYTTAYADYVADDNNVNAKLYLGNRSKRICHIADEARTSRIGSGDVAVGNPTRYIPDNMESASLYFARGLYQNEVVRKYASASTDVTLGLTCTKVDSGFWTIFDNFHLYYYGTIAPETVTGISDIFADGDEEFDGDADSDSSTGIYDLQGRRQTTLHRGLNIVNGKKILK